MKLSQVTRLALVLVGTVAAALTVAPASAQTPSKLLDGCNSCQKPLFDLGQTDAASTSASPGGSGRVRMFGMPTGYLSNPLGIDDDSAGQTGIDGQASANDLPGMSAAMGMYNPFFDLRRPDDPRNAGFYKCYMQYQVVNLGPIYASMTLQALFPAGRDADGVANGPTIVCPSFAWFHDLGGGTALQGYVGQSVHMNSRWAENMGTRIHYGVGIQTPVPEMYSGGEEGLFFFVQALGRYRYDTPADSRPVVWDIYPGVQYRLNDNCWFSVGASRRFLFTWCWQY
jgi:hypothetical protein